MNLYEKISLFWIERRNRVLASPRFQRAAAQFPPTRAIARRRARDLFDLVAGFTYSQTLAACVQTGLLELLADAPRRSDAVAAHADLPLAGAERLLRAAAGLGLVERVGDAWMLGARGAALRGHDGIAEMVAHHRLLYADLADPVALLRRGGGGGQLSDYWRYAESPGCGDATEVDAYSRLMAASQAAVAEQILSAYPVARHKRLLDVGGGEGAFLAAVGRSAPGVSRALFDLPAVVARARLGADVALHPGDFLRTPLPPGHDLITLVRVLHDHDDAPALTLLRAVRAALPRDGRLLIAEPMADTRGAAPVGDTYFGLYLLAMGSGRPRSAAELQAMLRSAGFSRSRRLRTALPLVASILLATP